ncbi:MAG: ABC transporter permease subunit [Bacillota bacterium]|nr:ABC transporter permease subunit [Bacillota bacterium]
MAGLQLAFKKYNVRLGIWGSPFIGFRNFIKFFNSYQFVRVVGNTLKISIYSLIAGFPIPIIFALILNSVRAERFKKTMQTVTYMPHFISVVVLVGIVVQIINPRVGLLSTVYSALNNGRYPPDLLANPGVFPHLYVWSGIWQTFGWNSIIYTAALASVSLDLHEAAQIDGASRFQRMIHVDLPAIMPTAIIMLIMRCGHIMSVGFEKVFLMQNDLNLSTSELISTYVYKVGLSSSGSMDFSYSTAIGLFNSIINLILIIIVNSISKRVSETSLW